ncbi:hypothetical protein FRC08_002910 [Ceratobasidium sp. 394]|nr:hypothetical protein FRC08_002910 [Ceratobasidium sp. 394]KAG9095208.1 hypothetical protein FS749_010871 [Ceratobasidium sp. UAMH 11750]
MTSQGVNIDGQPSLEAASSVDGDKGAVLDLDHEARESNQLTAPAQPHPVEQGSAPPSVTSIRTVTIQTQTQSDAKPTDPAQEAAILEEIGNMHTHQYQQHGQLHDINIAIA